METTVMEDNGNNRLKEAAKAGGIMGGVSILITLLVYIADPTFFGSMWFGLIPIIISIFLMIFLGRQYRKKVGGYLPYNSSFVFLFVMLAVGGLIGILFNILLYQVIDPQLPEVIKKSVMDNTTAFMQKMGTPSDQIDKTMNKLDSTFADRFSALQQLKSYLYGLIFYAVFAALFAFAVRKKPKEDEMM